MRKLLVLSMLLTSVGMTQAYATEHEHGADCSCSKECKENCNKGKTENCKCKECDCKKSDHCQK